MCSHRAKNTHIVARLARFTTVAIGICLFSSSVARADDTEDARNLFREGRALTDQGYFQAACSKFEKSLRIEPGSGTEFRLAECWEQIGRTASARKLYLKVGRDSQKSGLEKRAQLAYERADRLLTRVSRLQFQCDGSCPDGVQVYHENTRLLQSFWPEPVEVDPGRYQVDVPRSDGSHWTTQIDVPKDPGVVVVTIPVTWSQLATRKNSVPSSVTRTAEKGPTTKRTLIRRSPASSVPTANNSGSRLTKALLYTGAGGLIFGGGMALWLNHKNSQAEEICPSNEGCSNAEIAKHGTLVSDAKLARAGVYAGLGIGVLSISTAALLHFLSAPSTREQSPSHVAYRVHWDVVGEQTSWAVFAKGSF